MRSTRSKRVRLVEVGVITVCVACLRTVSADPNQALTKRLTEIRAAGRIGTEDQALLEAKCLHLLPDHNTPAERGRIYSTIALVYCERGFGPASGDKRQVLVAKTARYATKALEHPLDVSTACRMHGGLADAIITGALDGPEDKWPELRRSALVPCLKGLKLALDNKAPKAPPKPPPRIVVPHIISPKKGPAYQEARRRHEQQLAAWKQYDYLERLYWHRRGLTDRCAAIYSKEPYDLEEFRAYARKIVVGHDEAVSELIQLVEARIEARKKMHQPPANAPRPENTGSL